MPDQGAQFRVELGDNLDVMKTMPDASVDAVVCDPPYGLEFMGRDWDAPWKGDTRQPGDETFHKSGAGPFDRSKVRHGAAGSYSGDAAGNMRLFQAWCEAWAAECLRVLKPGGYLLAFGGTRTYHRLAAGVEDAGFEIRDTIAWMYGSGFPKSMNVGMAIDAAAGATREVVAEVKTPFKVDKAEADRTTYGAYEAGISEDGYRMTQVTAPATPEGAEWDGWGTALKPAYEPIVVARKPFKTTVAANVLEHGTGALNIDAARVSWGEGGDVSAARKAAGYSDAAKKALGGVVASESETGFTGEVAGTDSSAGRFPANVVLGHHDACVPAGTRQVKGSRIEKAYDGDVKLGYGGSKDGARPARGIGDADGMEVVESWECHPDCPVRLLDEQTGLGRGARGPASGPTQTGEFKSGSMAGRFLGTDAPPAFYGDLGGASRFFYCAKASRAERNAGLSALPDVPRGEDSAWIPRCSECAKHLTADERGAATPCCGAPVAWDRPADAKNVHPTVKPVEVMRWLIRLVCRPGGLVLDPFVGSGTTGMAAVMEGARFVGIERDEAYIDVARQRIAWWAEHGEKAVAAERATVERSRFEATTGQESLFG